MKREALSHTKMKRLCRRLDLPVWQGVGLLESLWHLTARETPRGDIGKLSDEDIALAIDYRGDERVLIDALVSAGWLDQDPVERLVVHDWPDHCEDSVHTRLARAKLYFVRGVAPKLSKLAGEERKTCAQFYSSSAYDGARRANDGALPRPIPLPVPEPLPEPTPQPVLRRPLSAGLDDTARITASFDEWIAPWPRCGDPDSALRNFISRVTPSNKDAAFAARDRYLASEEVARGVVMEPWKFIRTQADCDWSGKWLPAKRNGGRQASIDAEWEGITNGTR